jgi:hypothetical protein
MCHRFLSTGCNIKTNPVCLYKYPPCNDPIYEAHE